MSATDTLLYALALVGHAGVWIAFTNHIHSRGLPRWLVKLLSKASHAWMILGPVLFVVWARPRGLELVGRKSWSDIPWGLMFYFGCCWFAALGPLSVWLWRRWTRRESSALQNVEVVIHDLGSQHGESKLLRGAGRVFHWFPGNEMLRLQVNAKTLEVPGLPVSLDGLSIAHLSDLHMTGRVAPDYFHSVVDLVNEMQADLVAVTGDLVDREACIDWLPETLGRLESRLGVFYVLGNHDKKVNVARLRRTLGAAGLIDLAGQWRVLDLDGERILLGGNERPWFSSASEGHDCPVAEGATALRILLSHTPDEYAWARKQGYHLMLAGHTHGGQIALPVVGPIVCPSRYGVKYAGGVFHEPPTVLHVSRGASADVPIRWNCPPEITRLILRCPMRVAAPPEIASHISA